MGVDIQTYRGRIGCFSRNFGTDVITVRYIVNFTRGLKSIGAVVFIGILLLLAGIEENPGPISEYTSRQTPANATILKVCGLPKGIGIDSLINIFENTRRQGGGNVLRVDVDENNSSALVEFEEAEALQLVLRKRPIHIDGKDVSVEIYNGDYPMNENIGSQMDRAGEVPADKSNDLHLGSDSENVNKSGAAGTTTEGKIFYQVLQRLGLTDKFPGKISLKDIVAVDPNEFNEQNNRKISLTDIPWMILKRLMCAHSECRDITVSAEEHFETNEKLEDTISFVSEIPEEIQDISPLDIFTVVFQCCDADLKQIFVQKLYLCKLAVPFLYMNWESYEKKTPIISIWPLRSLAIENKQVSANKIEIQSKERDVLDLSTKVLAFGRLGRPRYSKSKLINSLLLSQGCKTFFNIDSPSGMSPRQINDGQIEIFWLPSIDERKDRFKQTMTFLNLRGDLCNHYSKDLLHFIANFIDSIVLVVDLGMILDQGKMVENIILHFSSVILIIADPLNHEAARSVKSFENGVTLSKSEIRLRILSTHKGTIERNIVDMLSNITTNISDHLKTNKTMSLEERLSHAKLASIKTDEEGYACQQGKLDASKLINQMKAEGQPSGWKQHLTPAHVNFSKQLRMLSKEKERARDDFLEGGKIDVKIRAVRRQQITSITKSVKLFLDILIQNSNCLLVLKYFLCWLHFYIEREKQKILPRLIYANQSALDQLKSLKWPGKQVEYDIIEKEETYVEYKNDEASFTVQHFFREIGHINEAILELEEDTKKFGLPTLHQMSNIIGRLVADGHHLELIDGESLYMPYLWIKNVFKYVDACIGSSKVMTLSVLGLQSSGKSTLLNTMFGSQFFTRTGRCTRGIHVQLIPTKSTYFGKTSSVFSYVLIVDTEGLRSPELSHLQHEHDNELATIIAGVSDMTMLNIMGENTNEIGDVLQIIVHAFLRLKKKTQDLDMRKSCALIHQNVSDTYARENMTVGLSKLMQTLDEMTKESARSEGIHYITTFNQVIEFDTTSQVWYLKNLWQGNPPMARVNNEYSESVVNIKCKILNKALTMNNKSFKRLTDIVEQAHSLWKGILNEDFVFSFRNCLEIKAYLEMRDVVQVELLRLECLICDKLFQISQENFSRCDEINSLRNVADHLISDLHELLLNEKIKTEETIEKYFHGNNYKDVTIQWKNSQQIRVNLLFETLQEIIRKHVEGILKGIDQQKNFKELRKRSVEVANAHKRQRLTNEKINQLFEDIWKECLSKVDTSSTCTTKNRRKMQTVFLRCLENMFKHKHDLLKQALIETNFLTPKSNVKQLAKSFCETGINKTDIRFVRPYWLFERHFVFGLNHRMKYVETRVNQIFELLDWKIKEICQLNDKVTEMSVNKLMHVLYFSLEAILSGDFELEASFYVKIYIHVSRHAHPIFESHNEE